MANVKYVTIYTIIAITLLLKENSTIIQTTSRTIFEVPLLEELTAQLTFSPCSFESQAEVFNLFHAQLDQIRLERFASKFRQSNVKVMHEDGIDWMLNVTRLEDDWFLYQLVSVFQELSFLDGHDLACCTAGNIEEFCQ